MISLRRRGLQVGRNPQGPGYYRLVTLGDVERSKEVKDSETKE